MEPFFNPGMQHHQQQQHFGAGPQPGAPPQFAPGPPPHFQYGYVPPQSYAFVAPPPPPAAPPAAPQAPPALGFFNHWEPPPPPAAPPADGELHKRIDKLAEYAAKNGPEFEALMKEKQKENPAYAFLFGAEGHGYYRYKLWVMLNQFVQPPFNPAMSIVSPALGLPAGITPPLVQPPGAFPAFAQPVPPPQPPSFEQGNLGTFAAKPAATPPEILSELRDRLDGLTNTKESVQATRTWFMQRSAFAPALAEALQERLIGWDKLDRQMNALYLVNDVLLNNSELRVNPKDLDAEALAFRPVLGPILRVIYRKAQKAEADKQQIEQMLQLWGEKQVYDWDTIKFFEKEMRQGHVSRNDTPAVTTCSTQAIARASPERRQEQPRSTGFHSAPVQFNAASASSSTSSLVSSFSASSTQQAAATSQSSAGKAGSEQAPYPHFPPGLIPGMVRKMQIGSGVPYSPLSPLDIPSVIPPATSSESYILDRVSKFFKDIGEPDPLANGSFMADEEREEEEERGAARIPPPSRMQYDPETGTLADGSVEHSSSGRLGLGAVADPNEVSQYDDVYMSYRKQRSTNYHSSLSARAAATR